MKKSTFYLLTSILLFIIVGNVKAIEFPGSGTQLTAAVPSDGLSLIENGKNITVRNDGSQNLDDYEGDLEYAQAKIKINVNVPAGTTLKEGDYFSIPITNYYTGTRRDMIIVDTDWSDLNDGSEVIGQWRIKNGQIQVVFNEKVNGKSTISQLEIITGTKGVYSGKTLEDRIGKIKIGEQIFYFRINGVPLTKINKDTKWQSGGSTNNNIYWAIRVGTELTRDTWNSRGEEGELVDAIIEDSFPGAESVTFSASKALYIPVSLSSNGISEKVFKNFGATSSFKKIVQTSGETYEEFKARVTSKPLQYGIYNDQEGTPNIIIYCGKLGADTPLYTENNINQIVNAFIIDEIYEETDRETLIEEFKKAYLNGKTNGHSTALRFYMRAYYPKTNVDRTIENTAKVTYNGVTTQLKRNGTLSATTGVGEVTSAIVKVIKKEKETNNLLQGAKIKLQFKSGDEWIDYTSPSTNKIEHETDINGELTFENLSAGLYRVVETKAPKGYDIEREGEEFEIESGSDQVINIELFNKKHPYKVTTHHYKEDSSEKIGEDTNETKYYGENYNTEPVTNLPEGYELVGTPENKAGTVEDSDIIVNYYYKLKDVELTIKHIDIDTNQPIIGEEKINYKYGNSYTTQKSNNIPSNYELAQSPTNASGTIKQNIEVIYYYKQKEAQTPTGKIIVKYTDAQGNILKEQTNIKQVGEVFTSNPEEIEGYTIKEKPATATYTYKEEEQIITYIYEKIKLKVVTKTNGKGGKIEGDEEVLYGNNSSTNKIKITANEGYIIDKVLINSVEIEVPKNSEKITLSNFVNMKENKLVEVTFKEKQKENKIVKQVVKVPPTSKDSQNVPIGLSFSILISIGAAYYYKKKYINNK